MSQQSNLDARVLIAGRQGTFERFQDALSAAGIRVVAECTTREQVTRAVAQTRPDVCVVDRDFAGGGLVAAAAIASPRRAPRVLLVGGSGTPSELRAARLAGAADSLPANADTAQLVSAVSALVGKADQ
jgi:DNA-binding NarL/FixJ family response regulator